MKHIILVGLNFYRKRHAGDKNFWIELLPYLATRLKKITILSVRDDPVPVDKYRIGECEVVVKYIAPKILRIGENDRKILYQPKRKFPGFIGALEKFLNTKEICSELKRIYEAEPYSYIHLMDNMGFANRIIAGNAPVKVSVSAMAYQGRNRLTYNRYLLFSYKHPNLTVVPYSHTYSQKLEKLGIPRERIKHIRWGVRVNTAERSEEVKRQFKAALSLPLDKPLFLWAGYIQQIGPKDFMLAYNCAKEALGKGLQANFYFAFKSKKIAEKFRHLHNVKQGIIVDSTTVEEFTLLKKAADIFYSPVYNSKVILAPPLTWIEVLNEGIPIITTDTPGADEVIDEGKTGFIVKNLTKGIVEKIFRISKCYKEIREHCYKKVLEECNIEKTAQRYLMLWGEG